MITASTGQDWNRWVSELSPQGCVGVKQTRHLPPRRSSEQSSPPIRNAKRGPRTWLADISFCP